jgi:hypothetical protein
MTQHQIEYVNSYRAYGVLITTEKVEIYVSPETARDAWHILNTGTVAIADVDSHGTVTRVTPSITSAGLVDWVPPLQAV